MKIFIRLLWETKKRPWRPFCCGGDTGWYKKKWGKSHDFPHPDN